jgi:hypothetical protein
MQLNYVILVHKNPLQLSRLVKRLSATDVHFYIHIDKAVSSQPFKDILTTFSNLNYVEDKDRENITWGDFSMVQATLNAIKMILAEKKNGYCILLSGQDYPLKSNNFISNYFTQNDGINFMESQPIPWDYFWYDNGVGRIENYNFHPKKMTKINIFIPSIQSKLFYRKRTIKQILKLLFSRHFYKIWVVLKKRKFPKSVSPHGGSQWWALPISTLKLIESYLNNNPNYIKFHKYTQVPDEIFFQTIISSKIAKNLISDKLTYVKWTEDDIFSPTTLTIEHFEELKTVRFLYARKFDINFDSQILDELDKSL